MCASIATHSHAWVNHAAAGVELISNNSMTVVRGAIPKGWGYFELVIQPTG